MFGILEYEYSVQFLASFLQLHSWYPGMPSVETPKYLYGGDTTKHLLKIYDISYVFLVKIRQQLFDSLNCQQATVGSGVWDLPLTCRQIQPTKALTLFQLTIVQVPDSYHQCFKAVKLTNLLKGILSWSLFQYALFRGSVTLKSTWLNV